MNIYHNFPKQFKHLRTTNTKLKKINMDYKMFTNTINIIQITLDSFRHHVPTFILLLGLLSYLISMENRNNSINFNQL